MGPYSFTVSSLETVMILRGFIPAVMIVIVGIMVGRWDAARHQQTLEKLISNIFLPCLAFSAIHKHPLAIRELLQIGSGVAILLCLLAIIAMVVLRGEPGCRCGLIPVVFMSSGSLLLPLSYVLFGNEGLAKAVYFHLFAQLGYYTLGVYLLEGRIRLMGFFSIPTFYVTILGGLASLSPLSVPENLQEFAWLSEKGIDITAMGAFPLLLINFGYPLGLLRLTGLGPGVNGGLLRILAGPLLAFLLVYVYHKTGWSSMDKGYDILSYIDRRTTEAILVLGAAMPSSHYVLRARASQEGLRAEARDAATLLVSVIGGAFTVLAVLILIKIFILVN